GVDVSGDEPVAELVGVEGVADAGNVPAIVEVEVDFAPWPDREVAQALVDPGWAFHRPFFSRVSNDSTGCQGRTEIHSNTAERGWTRCYSRRNNSITGTSTCGRCTGSTNETVFVSLRRAATRSDTREYGSSPPANRTSEPSWRNC